MIMTELFQAAGNLLPNMTNKILNSLIICLLLTSCAENYTVNTNLDKKNFEEYFAPSRVKMYKSIDEFSVGRSRDMSTSAD